MKLKESNYI